MILDFCTVSLKAVVLKVFSGSFFFLQKFLISYYAFLKKYFGATSF
jgi:hypothetical protein